MARVKGLDWHALRTGLGKSLTVVLTTEAVPPYRPDFLVQVRHSMGVFPFAFLDVGFWLNHRNRQLLFVFRTEPGQVWLALSIREVQFLNAVAGFFTSHNVYFGSWRNPGLNLTAKTVLCLEADYGEVLDMLTQYSATRDGDLANEVLENPPEGITAQAYLLGRILASFVDEATNLSDLAGLDPDDPSAKSLEDGIDEIRSQRSADLMYLDDSLLEASST